MHRLLFGIFFSLQMGALFAAPENFQLKAGKVSLNVPAGWQDVKNFAGMELMLVGPMKSSNRPVVTVSATDFAEFSIDTEALKKDEATYRSGREKWLEKYSGKVEEFFKYETKVLKDQSKVHALGFRYLIGDKSFTERTYYIQCEKNLYHFKSLVLTKEMSEQQKNLSSMLESFSCK